MESSEQVQGDRQVCHNHTEQEEPPSDSGLSPINND